MGQSISIMYSDPLWLSPRQAFMGNLADKLNSYTDVIVAQGGYDSASIELVSFKEDLEDWIENGLGRHIEVYNPSLDKRWEGFANEVVVTIGPLSLTIGPLLNVVNRAHLQYVDFTTKKDDTTATSNDTDSQDLFGIRYQVLSTGEVSSTNASSILSTFIAESRYPELSQALAQAGELSVVINCLGYYHLLDYPYNNATDNTYTLLEKLQEVMETDPNTLFSTDYTQMDANTLSVYETEDSDREAWEIIKDLVAMGPDSGNNRMIFGIYEDRTAYYNEVEQVVTYTQRLDDIGVNLRGLAGEVIDPWDILPGKWIEFTDFLVGNTVDLSLIRSDPRLMFIESVSYTASYDVQLSGGKTDTLPQQLAKLGLGGL